MVELAVMVLKPGMIIGKDVIQNGKVLYPAGIKINDNVVRKLNRYSIMCVTVMEDVDFATTHREKIQYDPAFKDFKQKYDIGLTRYKELIQQFIFSGRPCSDKELMNIYESISKTIPSNELLLDYIYNMMPNQDELTYSHCLASALLAGAFADWMHFNDKDKQILVLAGFYYDIGKLKLPYGLLWKPDKLNKDEYNMVKTHPMLGYALTEYLPLDQHIKNAIRMHHERYDGSGYPAGLSGNQIDQFASYFSIIDTYVAMASPRTYRNAFTPLSIVEEFERNVNKYDKTILQPLIKRIADAQIGSRVMLNNNTVWDVFIIHPNHNSRPILKNDNNELLDLMSNPKLQIIKCM